MSVYAHLQQCAKTLIDVFESCRIHALAPLRCEETCVQKTCAIHYWSAGFHEISCEAWQGTSLAEASSQIWEYYTLSCNLAHVLGPQGGTMA